MASLLNRTWIFAQQQRLAIPERYKVIRKLWL